MFHFGNVSNMLYIITQSPLTLNRSAYIICHHHSVTADAQPLSGAARFRCSHTSPLMINRPAVPYPSPASRFRLPPA